MPLAEKRTWISSFLSTPHLLQEDQESNATHVVASVLYGAEVFCILAQETDADKDGSTGFAKLANVQVLIPAFY